jgi:hypothetical protein
MGEGKAEGVTMKGGWAVVSHISAKKRNAGPSTTLRFAQDDSGEAGGPNRTLLVIILY